MGPMQFSEIAERGRTTRCRELRTFDEIPPLRVGMTAPAIRNLNWRNPLARGHGHKRLREGSGRSGLREPFLHEPYAPLGSGGAEDRCRLPLQPRATHVSMGCVIPSQPFVIPPVRRRLGEGGSRRRGISRCRVNFPAGAFRLHVTCILLCAYLGVQVASGESVRDLEGLVAQWVELRSQIASEQQAWAEQKRHLERGTALLRKEADELARDMAESRDVIAILDEQRTELQETRDELHQTLQALQPALESAEKALLKARNTLPASLGSGLMDAMARLPETPEQASLGTVARRMQLVMAIYTEMEKLQNNYHWVKEVINVGGGRRTEVEILYVGLSCGFAVSADGGWAAIGRPGPEGWTWEPRPSLGPEVRKAIDVLNRRRTPELVSLPLRISVPAGGVTSEPAPRVPPGEATP